MEPRKESPQVIAFVAPILPGQAEAWRRFAQELSGSRRDDAETACRRLGLVGLRLGLAQGPRGTLAIARVATTDPWQLLCLLETSPDPFDRWLRRQFQDLHGLDPATPRGTDLEEVFAWSDDNRKEVTWGSHRPGTTTTICEKSNIKNRSVNR